MLPSPVRLFFALFLSLALGGLAACGSSEAPSPVTDDSAAGPPEPAGFGELVGEPQDERSEAQRLADIRARLLSVRRDIEAARQDYGGSEPETSRLLAIQGHLSQLLRGLPERPIDAPSERPEEPGTDDAGAPAGSDPDGLAETDSGESESVATRQDAGARPQDLDEGGAPAASETASAPPGGQMPRRTSLRPLALHLASYRTVEQVREGWRLLREAHAPVLGDLQARVARAEVPGQGDYFRLYAGPIADRPGADDTCGRLQSRGGYCRVVPFDGVPLDVASQ